METNELWKIPLLPSTRLGHVHFLHKTERVDLGDGICYYSIWLLFDYRKDGVLYNGGLAFQGCQLYRYTSEELELLSDNYLGLLVEHIGSEWLQQLFKRNTEVAEAWKIRHFAISLCGYGILEVIAKDFKVLAPKEGSLKI